MPNFTTTATELKYASGSSWTSGKARQGVYSGTRYEGAIKFGGLSDLPLNNIEISQIQLRLTFAQAGGASSKYLTLYKGASNTISGSIASMRGASIGQVYITEAYNRTETLTFSASSHAALFNAIKAHIMAGSQVLVMYVPSTRGTYPGGYCYDYLGVTAAALNITYEFLQSDGSLASTSVAAGSAAKLNVTAYNSAYTHKVVWKFGTYSNTQNLAAGTTSASYTIPLSWLNAIPSATSGSATVSLETIDTNGNSLGTYTYGFTITAPASVVPSISSVTSSPVNSNTVIKGWGYYVYGKSQASIAINGAAGAYGSTIKSYSIDTDPSIGSASASTLTTGTITKTGTITITAKVVDSRGRSATKSTTITVYQYGSPFFWSITAYRCTSNGTRDDANGTYAYVEAVYGCYTVNGKNSVSGKVTLKQVGGSYSTTSNIVSGTGLILGAGSLASDAAYQAVITLTDTVGSVTTYTAEIQSAAYIMHIKKNGRAVGFGMAAGEDDTVSFGWPVKLTSPLEVAQGGTGGNSQATACANIGAVKKVGDTMTGDLLIRTSLYPSLKLTPTYNSTTNQTVFEGSYVGASSFAAWEDSSGSNRRMLEVRNAKYAPSMDNAVLLRTAVNNTWYAYRLFHAGMATPIPVANGGTGAANAKTALTNLGIFYADTLPSSGTDGQICLVPV